MILGRPGESPGIFGGWLPLRRAGDDAFGKDGKTARNSRWASGEGRLFMCQTPTVWDAAFVSVISEKLFISPHKQDPSAAAVLAMWARLSIPGVEGVKISIIQDIREARPK